VSSQRTGMWMGDPHKSPPKKTIKKQKKNAPKSKSP
jgi:hypothetical protein